MVVVAVEPDLFGYRIEARRQALVGRTVVARRQFVTSLAEAITAAGHLVHNYLQSGLKWVGCQGAMRPAEGLADGRNARSLSLG